MIEDKDFAFKLFHHGVPWAYRCGKWRTQTLKPFSSIIKIAEFIPLKTKKIDSAVSLVKVLFFIVQSMAQKKETEPNKTLFDKMAKAINLSSEDYMIEIQYLEDETQVFGPREAITIYEKFRPQIILSFGSQASSALLGFNENESPRMMNIHGIPVVKKIELSSGKSIESTIIPLFHPEFMSINQEMKKATWEDLKKNFLHQ